MRNLQENGDNMWRRLEQMLEEAKAQRAPQRKEVAEKLIREGVDSVEIAQLSIQKEKQTFLFVFEGNKVMIYGGTQEEGIERHRDIIQKFNLDPKKAEVIGGGNITWLKVPGRKNPVCYIDVDSGTFGSGDYVDEALESILGLFAEAIRRHFKIKKITIMWGNKDLEF